MPAMRATPDGRVRCRQPCAVVLAAAAAAALMACAGGGRAQVAAPATSQPWSLDRQPTPRTLEETLAALERGLDSGTLARLRVAEEDIAIRLVPTLGRWIAEHWGLWTRGPLFQHFAARGLDRTDDMAAVILTSFWRHLHYQPLRVDEQIRWYRHSSGNAVP
jgi:hypothetical protein